MCSSDLQINATKNSDQSQFIYFPSVKSVGEAILGETRRKIINTADKIAIDSQLIYNS